MPVRRGVSLVEVIVAAVLLAVGVSATLSTVASAARLRDGARSRESLAAAAHDRLGWIEARGCTVGDSSGTSTNPSRVALSWELRRAGSARAFTIDAQVPWGARSLRLSLEGSIPCASD